MIPCPRTGFLNPFSEWRFSTIPIAIFALLFQTIGVPTMRVQEASMHASRGVNDQLIPLPGGILAPTEASDEEHLPVMSESGAPAVHRTKSPTSDLVSPQRYAEVMAQAREEQHYFRSKESGASADHPALGLALHYDEDGMAITPRFSDDLLFNTPAWESRFSFSSVKIDEQPLSELSHGSHPMIVADQVRQEVAEETTEWWINAESGPEHGFTINRSPYGEGKKLVVDLSLSGDLEPVQEGGTIYFNDHRDHTVFSYSKLIVFDATGRELPSGMHLAALGDAWNLELQADLSGAVFPVTIDPVISGQIEEELASDGGAGDEFGFASDGCGDIVAVSSPGKGSGKVYVFQEDPGAMMPQDAWDEVATVVVPGSETPVNGDRFGESVAVFKDLDEGKTYLAVGAPEHDGTGSVFIYERNEGGTDNWGFLQIIQDGDLSSGDNFGKSMDGLGDTLVVGAPSHGAGAVFVHEVSSCVFTRTQKVTSAAAVPTNSDEFGYSVAIGGDHMIIGAPGENSENGAGYLYKRSSPYAYLQRFVSADSESGARFGAVVAMAITGLLFAISMPWDDVGVGPTLVDAGTVLIFTLFAATLTWGLLSTIYGNEAGALFGASLVLNFFYDLAVGSTGATSTIGVVGGAVFLYLFNKLLFNYDPGDKIVPSTFIDVGMALGTSIVLLGTTLFILGAAYNFAMGAMFIFALFATPLTFALWQKLFWTDDQIANNPEITGCLADPDKDGLVNKVEFAMFLIPILFTPLAYYATLRSDGNYQLIIQESLAVLGIVLIIQYSQLLNVWFKLGTGPLFNLFSVEVLHQGIQARQLVLTVPTLVLLSAFLRVAAE